MIRKQHTLNVNEDSLQEPFRKTVTLISEEILGNSHTTEMCNQESHKVRLFFI